MRERWLSGSRRHALASVPGTLIPGLASGLSFIVIARVAGADVLGLTSLAWVTTNLGSSVLALGPSHAALRSTVLASASTLPQYRAIVARRSVRGALIPIAVGAALALAGSDTGVVIMLGGIWLPAQCIVLFDSEVLRAEGRFGSASWLLCQRAVLGWTASVVVATRVDSAAVIVVAQVVVSSVVAGAIVIRRSLHAPHEEVERAARDIGRPVSQLAVASYTLGYADRYVVEAIEGPSAVGIYTLGYTLGQGALEVVMTPITNALIPRLVSETQEGHADHALRTVRRASALLLAAGAASIPGVWILSVTGLLDHVSQDSSIGLITALVAVSTAVQGVTRLMYGVLLGLARPDLAAKAFWLVVAFSAIAVPVLTAVGGITGAAWATLLQYVFLAVVMTTFVASLRRRA